MRSRRLFMLAVFAFVGCGGMKTKMDNSWVGDVSPVDLEMKRLLSSRDRVALAIIVAVDSVYSAQSFKTGGADIEQWRQGMKNANTGGAEARFLQLYGADKRFQIVDRSTLDKITDEWFLSAKSNVSDETRLKIGALTGATHLFITSISRSGGAKPGDFTDTVVSHLVDAETGQVLAAQVQTARTSF